MKKTSVHTSNNNNNHNNHNNHNSNKNGNGKPFSQHDNEFAARFQANEQFFSSFMDLIPPKVYLNQDDYSNWTKMATGQSKKRKQTNEAGQVKKSKQTENGKHTGQDIHLDAEEEEEEEEEEGGVETPPSCCCCCRGGIGSPGLPGRPPPMVLPIIKLPVAPLAAAKALYIFAVSAPSFLILFAASTPIANPQCSLSIKSSRIRFRYDRSCASSAPASQGRGTWTSWLAQDISSTTLDSRFNCEVCVRKSCTDCSGTKMAKTIYT